MHGICHAEVSLSGQVWRVNDTDCDFKALIRFNFSNSEHYMPAKKTKEIITFHHWPSLLTGCSCLVSEFQETHPSTKDKDQLAASTGTHHSTSQSKERKSPANVRTPSITSAEPSLHQPKNPSGATASLVGHVHRGPSRDQLVDHGGMASCSRAMQWRPASVRRGRHGSCGFRGKTKAYSHGMFLQVVGQNVDRP